MVIFLYGSDAYRSRQKLNEIISHYKKIHKSGVNLEYLDLEHLNFEDLNNKTQQVSMFGEKKLIVLTNVFTNQDFKEKFFKNSKPLLESEDIIVVYEENIPRKDKFFEFLKTKTKSQESKQLGGENLRNWLRQEISNYQAKVSPEAETLLIDMVGSDLWQLSNEIKKLANFKDGKIIEKEDIELLVKPAIETDIFDTIDAIALKDKKRAISLLHKHLEKGESPLYLLSMINFQFRNLLIVKDLIEKNKPYYSISKISKLHPFVVKKTYQQAKNFSFQGLKKIYQRIFEVDLSIKTGKVEPETALDLLIAEV